MASGDNEPAKLLLPYLQRADELQKHEPLVAYYCRLYAMERGLNIPQADRTKTTNAILISLMKQLEKDKKSLKLGPDDHLHIEGFALNIFARADKQDRAGRADLTTAKTFYAASIFFEILNQFGELQSDLEQKQKYAAWKAADIRKAMKEGRKPEPGPPVDEVDTYDLGPSRSGSAGKVGLEFNTSPHFDKNQLSMNNLQSPHFNDLVNNHETAASIPPPSPSYPTSSYSSQDSQPPPSSAQPSHYNDKANDHQSTTIPPTPPFSTANYSSRDFHPPSSIPQSSHYNDKANDHQSTNIPPTPPFSTANYSSQDFQPPSTTRSENSNYSHSYHHLPHSQEPQQQVPQNYHPYESSPYSYANFQTYPSFTESSLPTAPTHYPSFHHQSSEASLSPHSTLPSVVNGPSSGHNINSTSGTALEPAQTSAQSYQYDCNYQPPPEKIADAHKAARFAVGALAFDDVPTAVDHLRKSLELLTNPSAGY